MLLANDLILLFRRLLVASWPVVEEAERASDSWDFRCNWLQANWEMMLENALCQRARRLVVLTPYGEGSEGLHYGTPIGYQLYDRVSLPTVRPNHRVICRPRVERCINPITGEAITDRDQGYPVFGFGCLSEPGRVESKPPFDVCILLDDEDLQLIAYADELDYWAVPYDGYPGG